MTTTNLAPKRLAIAASLTMALAAISTPATASQQNTFANGKFSFDSRVFYFNRSFDKDGMDNADALTFGGVMKYTTGELYGASLGFGYYGNYRLFDIIEKVNDNNINATALLKTNGDDVSFLGEAYLSHSFDGAKVVVGRQVLSTPLINGFNIRTLPTSFEAAKVELSAIENTLLEAGWVRAFTGTSSMLGAFTRNEKVWGKDGLGYIYAKTKVGNASLKGQYVRALEDSASITSYTYAEGKMSLPTVGEKTFVKSQLGMTEHNGSDNGFLAGIMGGTSVGPLDFSLLYTKIMDNTYNGVVLANMYSNWQQGYGRNEPSNAYGARVTYRPMSNASVMLGYIQVDVDDSNGNFKTDDYSEINLDATYRFTADSKLRLRFSHKDQTKESGREDRNDLRVIYYHKFH